MIPFGPKNKRIAVDEKSESTDFSGYAVTKRLNGFQHMSESALGKLRRELKLRMSAKSLRNLRKYFAGVNAPTVLALRIVDSYWSSGNGYLDREISQIELVTENPHVLKALKLYDKLRKEFNPEENAPRTLKELLSLSAKAVISDSRDVIRYSHGKFSLECECYEKGRRTRYFSDIISRWDNNASEALRRCAVIGVVSGGSPVAVIREEYGDCPVREQRNFGRYAESLDLPAYDYGRDKSAMTSAAFTETAVLCARDSFDENSEEISKGDKILLISYKNTEREGLKELADFLAECNSAKLISKAY